MRTIEANMLRAIRAQRSRSFGNTTVVATPESVNVFLHGNRIASVRERHVEITLAGWPTVTTRSRINAILGAYTRNCRVYQHRGAQYLRLDDSSDCTVYPHAFYYVDRTDAVRP